MRLQYGYRSAEMQQNINMHGGFAIRRNGSNRWKCGSNRVSQIYFENI